jgi:GDPmannose 4,6-dehydratase
MAFAAAGIRISFRGNGEAETAVVEAIHNSEAKVSIGQTILQIDPGYFRPTEVELLIGNPAKAKEKLGWSARTSLKDLVEEMVKSDLEEFRKEVVLRGSGYSIRRPMES